MCTAERLAKQAQAQNINTTSILTRAMSKKRGKGILEAREDVEWRGEVCKPGPPEATTCTRKRKKEEGSKGMTAT